jgi:hypothetical protein
MMFYSVAGDSVAATTGAASALLELPNDGAGNDAKYVRIAAKGNIYCRPARTGGSVTAANGILVQSGDAITLNVAGYTHIAHIQDAGAIAFTVTPIESA